MIITRLLGSGTVSALAIIFALAASPAAAATPAPITPSAIGAPASLAETLAPAAELQDQRRRGGRAERRGQRSGASAGGLGRGARTSNTGSWNGAQSRANRGGGSRWNSGAQARPADRTRTRAAPAARTRTAPAVRSSRSSGSYDRSARSSNRNAGAASTPTSSARYNRQERRNRASERSAYRAGSNPASNGASNGYAARSSNTANAGRGRGPASGTRYSGASGAGTNVNSATPTYRAGNTTEQSRDRSGRQLERTGRTAGNPAAVDQRNMRGTRADRRGRDWNNGRGVTARGDVRGNARRDDVRRDRRGNWQNNRRVDNRRINNRRADNRRIDNRRIDNRRGNWRDNRRGGRQAAYNQGFRNGARWDRGWRNNNRFNWIGHRQANRFLFAPGRYYAPFAGHFYRPVGIGFRLDPLFFQPRFFLNDPWAFRLPPAGDRFRWVRYYEDVLLVDVFTGEVVDVIENFFW